MPELKVFLSHAALAEFADEMRELDLHQSVTINPTKPRPETVECLVVAIREYYRTRRG